MALTMTIVLIDTMRDIEVQLQEVFPDSTVQVEVRGSKTQEEYCEAITGLSDGDVSPEQEVARSVAYFQVDSDDHGCSYFCGWVNSDGVARRLLVEEFDGEGVDPAAVVVLSHEHAREYNAWRHGDEFPLNARKMWA